MFLILDAIDQAVLAQMQKNGGAWQCLACGWEAKIKTRLYEHVEAKHVETNGYSCPICGKFCSSQKGLKNHKFKYHRNSGAIQFWIKVEQLFTFFVNIFECCNKRITINIVAFSKRINMDKYFCSNLSRWSWCYWPSYSGSNAEMWWSLAMCGMWMAD